MKAVILDAASLGDDIDLSPLRDAVDTLTVHDTTASDDCLERLEGATIAIVNKVLLSAETLEALTVRLEVVAAGTPGAADAAASSATPRTQSTEVSSSSSSSESADA